MSDWTEGELRIVRDGDGIKVLLRGHRPPRRATARERGLRAAKMAGMGLAVAGAAALVVWIAARATLRLDYSRPSAMAIRDMRVFGENTPCAPDSAEAAPKAVTDLFSAAGTAAVKAAVGAVAAAARDFQYVAEMRAGAVLVEPASLAVVRKNERAEAPKGAKPTAYRLLQCIRVIGGGFGRLAQAGSRESKEPSAVAERLDQYGLASDAWVHISFEVEYAAGIGALRLRPRHVEIRHPMAMNTSAAGRKDYRIDVELRVLSSKLTTPGDVLEFRPWARTSFALSDVALPAKIAKRALVSLSTEWLPLPPVDPAKVGDGVPIVIAVKFVESEESSFIVRFLSRL